MKYIMSKIRNISFRLIYLWEEYWENYDKKHLVKTSEPEEWVVLHVNRNGDDTGLHVGKGSKRNPFKTIQKAMAEASIITADRNVGISIIVDGVDLEEIITSSIDEIADYCEGCVDSERCIICKMM